MEEKIQKVMSFIDATAGRIFSVTFTKRSTGETRRLIARTGVYKGRVTGAGMSYDPRSRGLVTVYSLDSEGYRMIPCESVTRIRFAGQEINFNA